MATIVTRSGKGSPLTNNEVDANFTNLNSDKLESGDTVASLTLTSADINGGTIDGTVIGGASAAAATFTDVTANGAINFTGATVSNGGSVTTVDINGGTIDGTVIGGSTPAAISGTDLTLSGGVYLGGTGAANYMDDYEEGTFTPSVNDGTTSITLGTGTYTKIGKVVTCIIQSYNNANFASLSTSGNLQITGFPFSGASGAVPFATNNPNNISLYLDIAGGSSWLWNGNNAVDYTFCSKSTIGLGTSAASMRGQFTYTTT